MSFFEDASLVLIPSAQKTSKVYSVKPTDGTGDLTFTRSNDTATRVGPDGLIEKVRTNLITYSNDFTNAAYSKITDGTYTITSETITDPFGNSVAVKKVTLTSGGYLVLRNTLGSATTSPTTGSVYIKKTVSTTGVDTDLSDGGVAVSANNTNWQRLVSINPASVYGSGTFLDINITTLNEPVYIAYAQIELSDFGATDYIATTSAAVSVGPVANVPRLDYLNSSCPRLILEGQRTNLWTYSEDLNSLAFKVNVTVSSNVAASPDGYTNADKLIETAAAGNHFTYGPKATVTSGTAYTMSFFAKAGERRYLVFQGDGQSGALGNPSVYDLQNGTIYYNANTTNTITPYGNGWYRITVTATASANGTVYPFFAINESASTSFQSYNGDGASGYFLYGFQTESATYATSYIPTLGAAVTRGADAASKTGISSLIGQTEGTLFAEFTYNGVANSGVYEVILVIGTNTNNLIALNKNNTTSELYAYSINGGAIQVNSVGIAGTNILGTHKVALAYKLNDYAVYLDGVQVFTDTSATVPACSGVYVGQSEISTQQLGGTVNQAILFPTRLSNADLAALTA